MRRTPCGEAHPTWPYPADPVRVWLFFHFPPESVQHDFFASGSALAHVRSPTCVGDRFAWGRSGRKQRWVPFVYSNSTDFKALVRVTRNVCMPPVTITTKNFEINHYNLAWMPISVVTNIRIRIRIWIFSSESRIFGFGFVIFARRIIFGFGFIIESWHPNLNLFNIFNLQNLCTEIPFLQQSSHICHEESEYFHYIFWNKYV